MASTWGADRALKQLYRLRAKLDRQTMWADLEDLVLVDSVD